MPILLDEKLLSDAQKNDIRCNTFNISYYQLTRLIIQKL